MENLSKGVSRREFLGLGAAAAGLTLGALFARPSFAAEAASASHDGEVKGAASSAKSEGAAASAAKDGAKASSAKDAAASTNASAKAAVSTELPMVVDRKNKIVFLALQVTENTTAAQSQVLTAFESSSDGSKCVLRCINSDLETWEGLQTIGAAQGSKVTLTLQWGKGDELPIEQCVTASNGSWAPDFSVSGSRDGAADPTGDIVALTSSTTALISDASTGADVTFTGNKDVLPKVGTNVTLAIRLA